jgi:isoquinoline 1-oxidoreductase subunit beta
MATRTSLVATTDSSLPATTDSNLPRFEFTVNGKAVTVRAVSHYPLLWVLRDDLKLTGTKFGCGIGECAVCLVDVDGKPTHACITPVSHVVGKKVTTIEGLASNGQLTAVQQAWIDEQVPQCGWCQSGQIMMAEALLREHPKPTAAEMNGAMFQVLCRCGTYPRIKCAINRASGQATDAGHSGANVSPGAAGSNGKPAAVPLDHISKHVGAKVKLAKGTKAEAAQVSDGLRFGTFYRAAGHLAIPTTAIFEQSADAPTAVEQAGTFAPNCWVTIRRDGTTVIESSHSEQGQGILTGIMSAIVDEADSDWDKVEIYEAGLSSEAPYISHSITGGFTMMDDLARFRHAGATVRAMMKAAAASTWKVPVGEIETYKGVASHHASGKTATYGELVTTARDLPVPTDVTLKTRAEWELIGKWVPRVDIPEKVNGSAIYPIDMDLPGMLVGVPVLGYTYGSTVRWYDDSTTLKVPGVKKVVQVPEFASGYPQALLVLADNYYAATLGAQELRVVWNNYPANQLNSREIMGKIRALADQPGTRTLSNDGDVKDAFAHADHVIERYFETPYLAHLPMAPMNAVASVHDGKIEVWAGLATPLAPFADIILEMGLIEHPDDLVIHQPYVGGQFGRANDWDHVLYAVYGSQQAGAPVKVIYDRVTDTRVTPYYPAGGIKVRVGVDKAGMPVAWQINMVCADMASQPKFAMFLGAFERTPSGIPYDPFPFRTIVDSFAYPAPAFQVQHRDPDVKVPAGFMRGVGATPNTFAVERMIDELAKQAGIDALAYRKALIKDARLMAVLDAVAARANWGEKLPAGSAQGISVGIYDTSRFACIAEASVTPAGTITVTRVTVVADPGIVVDPGSVHGQIEGGAIFGLSSVLHGGIDIVGGGTAQANLDTTHFLRFNEVPEIDIALISTDNKPGALGEIGTIAVAGAVANALSRATGVGQYKFPFEAVDLIPSPNC